MESLCFQLKPELNQAVSDCLQIAGRDEGALKTFELLCFGINLLCKEGAYGQITQAPWLLLASQQISEQGCLVPTRADEELSGFPLLADSWDNKISR